MQTLWIQLDPCLHPSLEYLASLINQPYRLKRLLMQFALHKLHSCASPPPYLGRITSCQAPLRIDTVAADLSAEGATSRD